MDDSILTALKPKWCEFIPDYIKPTPKQAAFLMLPHREAMFGGAAGSGKTVVLAMLALQYADVPGYNGIVFRRTLVESELGGAVLDVLWNWLSPRIGRGGDVSYNGSSYTFTFLKYGTSLTMAYLKNEYDHERYKGTSFQTIIFDELTDFVEDQYLFLNRSLRRSATLNIPLRIRSATNPGGAGHQWVKTRFQIRKCTDCCLKDGIWRGHNPDYAFMQAKLVDNPHLDQTSYTLSLNNMSTIDRLRMKDGDWDISEGARFKPDWFSNRWELRGAYFHCPQINKSWHRSTCDIFISMDVAASTRDGVSNVNFRVNQGKSFTVMSVWARTYDNYLIWLDQIRIQAEVPDILDKLISVARVHRPNRIIIDSQGIGKGVAQMAEFLGLPIDPVPTTSDKIQNSATAQTRAKRGKVILPQFSPWLDILTGELFTWTGHPHETDDQIDALSNACLYVQGCVNFGEREYDTQPATLPTTSGDGWTNGYAAGSYPYNPFFSGEESQNPFGN
jgi:predicted phage terminase large subunit-like protein